MTDHADCDFYPTRERMQARLANVNEADHPELALHFMMAYWDVDQWDARWNALAFPNPDISDDDFNALFLAGTYFHMVAGNFRRVIEIVDVALQQNTFEKPNAFWDNILRGQKVAAMLLLDAEGQGLREFKEYYDACSKSSAILAHYVVLSVTSYLASKGTEFPPDWLIQLVDTYYVARSNRVTPIAERLNKHIGELLSSLANGELRRVKRGNLGVKV